MPKIKMNDGTNLYYEEAGTGTPVVFVHEFAGDYRTWESQVRYFSRLHRCVTYSQRGYPPSDVPTDPDRYGQDIARGDVIALMDALGIAKAHVVGHSMGAYTALHVGIHHPQRCISVTAAGCGWGSLPEPAAREAMRQLALENANMFVRRAWPSPPRFMATAPCGIRRNSRTRAATPNSCRCCQNIRRKATRSPWSGCKRGARPSGTWKRI